MPPPPARPAAAGSRPGPSASCPSPSDLGFPHADQAVLLERYVTVKKNGRWVMRNCEAVLYVTSLDAAQASPADLLAYARGHWQVEHLHWLRDVVWREDKSTLRTGNAAQVMSALTNLVITLIPATRSNQDHGGNAPQRPKPPPAAPANRPPARLNTPQDFDESLAPWLSQIHQRYLREKPPGGHCDNHARDSG